MLSFSKGGKRKTRAILLHTFLFTQKSMAENFEEIQNKREKIDPFSGFERVFPEKTQKIKDI